MIDDLLRNIRNKDIRKQIKSIYELQGEELTLCYLSEILNHYGFYVDETHNLKCMANFINNCKQIKEELYWKKELNN